LLSETSLKHIFTGSELTALASEWGLVSEWAVSRCVTTLCRNQTDRLVDGSGKHFRNISKLLVDYMPSPQGSLSKVKPLPLSYTATFSVAKQLWNLCATSESFNYAASKGID
jgi:hypothetical protein